MIQVSGCCFFLGIGFWNCSPPGPTKEMITDGQHPGQQSFHHIPVSQSLSRKTSGPIGHQCWNRCTRMLGKLFRKGKLKLKPSLGMHWVKNQCRLQVKFQRPFLMQCKMRCQTWEPKQNIQRGFNQTTSLQVFLAEEPSFMKSWKMPLQLRHSNQGEKSSAAAWCVCLDLVIVYIMWVYLFLCVFIFIYLFLFWFMFFYFLIFWFESWWFLTHFPTIPEEILQFWSSNLNSEWIPSR